MARAEHRQWSGPRATKHGDDYLRTLLIQGAKSEVMSARKPDDPISRWRRRPSNSTTTKVPSTVDVRSKLH